MQSETTAMDRLNRAREIASSLRHSAIAFRKLDALKLFDELLEIIDEAQSDRLDLAMMAARLANAHDDKSTVNSIPNLNLNLLCAEIGGASMHWRGIDSVRKLLARILWAMTNRQAGGHARCRGLNPKIGPVRERNPMPPDNEVVNVELTDNQRTTLSINPLDKGRNPAKIDGSPQWVNSNPALIDLSVAEDGKSAVASTKDGVGLGECDVTVSADADLGEGVTTLQTTFHLNVIGDEASSLNGSFTAPEARN